MAGASKSDSFSEEKGGTPCWFGTRMAWPLEFLPTTARPARRTLEKQRVLRERLLPNLEFPLD